MVNPDKDPVEEPKGPANEAADEVGKKLRDMAAEAEANPPKPEGGKKERTAEEQALFEEEARKTLLAMGAVGLSPEQEPKVLLSAERFKQKENLTNQQLMSVFKKIRESAIATQEKILSEEHEKWEKTPEKDREYGKPRSQQRREADELLERIQVAFNRFHLDEKPGKAL